MKNNVQDKINNHSEDYSIFSAKEVPNILLSAMATTFGIALIKVPFDKMIQSLSANAKISLSQSLRSTFSFAVWRCLPSFVVTSMPRSYFSIYSKNSTKSKENEVHNKEHELHADENLLPKIEKAINKITHISNLAFIEASLAHFPDQKMAIDQRNIAYKPCSKNWFKIYKAGYGLDFSTSAVGLTCLTHVNQFFHNLLIGDKHAPSMTHGFLTGSLSGVTSALLTYPIKQIKTHVTLQAQVKDGILHYPSSLSIFKTQLYNLQETPFKQTVQSISKNLLLRSASNALTFGVIIAISNLIGTRPYDDLKKQIGMNK